MRESIATVASAIADTGDPRIVGQGFVLRQFHVNATKSNTFSVDTWKVGFAANATRVTAIEGVVPNVELPDRRGIDGGDEIANIVDNVDNVFVRSNTIEGRHIVVGELVTWHF